MLLDLCITLLLEKLQSVFDSEDFGTIAQNNSTFKKALEHTMKKQWTIHVKNPLTTLSLAEALDFFWDYCGKKMSMFEHATSEEILRSKMVLDLLEIRSQS